MKEINVDVVPLLPMKDIINGECVAIGVVEAGVLVHYIDRDIARIVEWSDIASCGIRSEPDVIPDQSESIREISTLASE